MFQFLCLLVCMAMNDDEFTLKPRKIKFKAKINPFTPGNFAEKSVLKLVEWFSGHCRAIKS